MFSDIRLYKSNISNRIVLGSMVGNGSMIGYKLQGIEVVGRDGANPSLEFKDSWQVNNFRQCDVSVEFKNTKEYDGCERRISVHLGLDLDENTNIKQSIVFFNRMGKVTYLSKNKHSSITMDICSLDTMKKWLENGRVADADSILLKFIHGTQTVFSRLL